MLGPKRSNVACTAIARSRRRLTTPCHVSLVEVRRFVQRTPLVAEQVRDLFTEGLITGGLPLAGGGIVVEHRAGKVSGDRVVSGCRFQTENVVAVIVVQGPSHAQLKPLPGASSSGSQVQNGTRAHGAVVDEAAESAAAADHAAQLRAAARVAVVGELGQRAVVVGGEAGQHVRRAVGVLHERDGAHRHGGAQQRHELVRRNRVAERQLDADGRVARAQLRPRRVVDARKPGVVAAGDGATTAGVDHHHAEARQLRAARPTQDVDEPGRQQRGMDRQRRQCRQLADQPHHAVGRRQACRQRDPRVLGRVADEEAQPLQSTDVRVVAEGRNDVAVGRDGPAADVERPQPLRSSDQCQQRVGGRRRRLASLRRPLAHSERQTLQPTRRQLFEHLAARLLQLADLAADRQTHVLKVGAEAANHRHVAVGSDDAVASRNPATSRRRQRQRADQVHVDAVPDGRVVEGVVEASAGESQARSVAD